MWKKLYEWWGLTGHRGRLTRALSPTIATLRGVILDVGGGRPGWRDTCWSQNLWRIRVDIDPTHRPDVLADALSLPFRISSVDAVVMREILEHIHSPVEAIAEAHRVLCHGGIFCGSVPFMFPVHADPSDYFRYTAEGLRHLLKAFSLVKVVAQGNHFGAAWTLVSSRSRIYRTLNPVMRCLGVKTDDRCPEGYTFVAIK